MELSRRGERLRAILVNGRERQPVPEVEWDGRDLVLSMPHYDARIEARLDEHEQRFEGAWTKRSGPERVTTLPFRAEYAPRQVPREGSAPEAVAGRWAVDFSSSEEPAVAVLEVAPQAHDPGRPLLGTFLTTLGDYRFLAGDFADGELVLSCFDGAHAFLFRARLQEDGTLRGDFWSGDRWHETWTARRDADAQLPDPFGLTRARPEVDLDALVFPDLTGAPRSLGDPDFAGKARILQVFGSWCPNCNDEARYLAELDRRYRERGLSIVGLGFELTGDAERDTEQLRRYAARHRLRFPLLLAGTADKAEAAQAFPLLERVLAFPTTIFLDREGRVRAVHTGFAGPATGPDHEKLRADFERLIEELLDTPETR